jgi:hypothetical protein
MTVVEVEVPAERSRICERVLRDEGCERTRRFYEACGFVPVEEIHRLWEHNPCLLMVKRL